VQAEATALSAPVHGTSWPEQAAGRESRKSKPRLSPGFVTKTFVQQVTVLCLTELHKLFVTHLDTVLANVTLFEVFHLGLNT